MFTTTSNNDTATLTNCDMDDELVIENDKEIERLGSKAAVEFMTRHERLLERLALLVDAPATTATTTTTTTTTTTDAVSLFAKFLRDEQQEEHDPQGESSLSSLPHRLYLTLRSNITEPLHHVGSSSTTSSCSPLNTHRWANLLLCMQDRIPDYNFITLLRPNAFASYQEQRDDLLIVPRAQFVLVELARCQEGCYSTSSSSSSQQQQQRQWRHETWARLSRRHNVVLERTKRFHTLSVKRDTGRQEQQGSTAARPKSNFQRLMDNDDDVDDDDEALQRFQEQMKAADEYNTAMARRGDQLNQCVTVEEAINRIGKMKTNASPLFESVERRIKHALVRDSTTVLGDDGKAQAQASQNGKSKSSILEQMSVTVVDSVLDPAICQQICRDALVAQEKPTTKGNGRTTTTWRRIEAQSIHRGDDVWFLPLLDEESLSSQSSSSQHSLLPSASPAKTLLIHVSHVLSQIEKESVLESNTITSNNSNPLLVPNFGQLALYDGTKSTTETTTGPGYVAHLDNCTTVGGEGENYREYTAILYLNDADTAAVSSPPSTTESHIAAPSGGHLRCYLDSNDVETADNGDEVENKQGEAEEQKSSHGNERYEDVVPKTGRLVIFPSRFVLHEVTPVVGWKRLALSAWFLRDSRKEVFGFS